MGKGDKKSKRGKIVLGTFGVRRLRKKSKTAAAVTVKATDEVVKTVVNEEIALETVAEAVVEQEVVKEKAPAKAAKPAKEKKETKTEKPVKAEKPAKEPKAKKEKKTE